jgi:hypothetical protein
MSSDNRNTDGGRIDIRGKVDDISEKGFIVSATKGWVEKVNEINKKYSKPRLKMTPFVRAALLALRLYLIMLVIILVYKFYTLVR